MYLWRDSYKKFAYIYWGIQMKGEIHIKSSHIYLTGFIYRDEFI